VPACRRGAYAAESWAIRGSARMKTSFTVVTTVSPGVSGTSAGVGVAVGEGVAVGLGCGGAGVTGAGVATGGGDGWATVEVAAGLAEAGDEAAGVDPVDPHAATRTIDTRRAAGRASAERIEHPQWDANRSDGCLAPRDRPAPPGPSDARPVASTLAGAGRSG
jgi:hypothetical protein